MPTPKDKNKPAKTDDKVPAKIGRPTSYNLKTVEALCEQIALGRSLRSVIKYDDGMPAMSTVFKWLREHEEFSKLYARATEERSEAMAEEILDIADDGRNDWMEIEAKNGTTYSMFNKEAAQRSRIRIDTRKWLMAKMKPKKFGDHLDIDQSTEVTHKFEDMTDEQLEAAIKARKDRVS